MSKKQQKLVNASKRGSWGNVKPITKVKESAKVYNRKKQNSQGCGYDMYPQYWTPSIGGILMKYSYKFKRQCVELYRQGKWPETPKDITEKISTIQSEFGFG